jgi:hypothetical protein
VSREERSLLLRIDSRRGRGDLFLQRVQHFGVGREEFFALGGEWRFWLIAASRSGDYADHECH